MIEKFCYDDNPANCISNGGLYQWDEMMQYQNQEGTQGICPPGWHVPADAEWMILEGAVDSQYEIREFNWNNLGYRGYDAGLNLKSTTGWDDDGNGTDPFSFTALPAGFRDYDGLFSKYGKEGNWWTSAIWYPSFAWYHSLSFESSGRGIFLDNPKMGRSVRCVKNY